MARPLDTESILEFGAAICEYRFVHYEPVHSCGVCAASETFRCLCDEGPNRVWLRPAWRVRRHGVDFHLIQPVVAYVERARNVRIFRDSLENICYTALALETGGRALVRPQWPTVPPTALRTACGDYSMFVTHWPLRPLSRSRPVVQSHQAACPTRRALSGR